MWGGRAKKQTVDLQEKKSAYNSCPEWFRRIKLSAETQNSKIDDGTLKDYQVGSLLRIKINRMVELPKIDRNLLVRSPLQSPDHWGKCW